MGNREMKRTQRGARRAVEDREQRGASFSYPDFGSSWKPWSSAEPLPAPAPSRGAVRGPSSLCLGYNSSMHAESLFSSMLRPRTCGCRRGSWSSGFQSYVVMIRVQQQWRGPPPPPVIKSSRPEGHCAILAALGWRIPASPLILLL